MTTFIADLELSELFDQEAVQPILESRSLNVSYSTALIGYKSEVLGFDTPQSTDHHWGSRLLLF